MLYNLFKKKDDKDEIQELLEKTRKYDVNAYYQILKLYDELLEYLSRNAWLTNNNLHSHVSRKKIYEHAKRGLDWAIEKYEPDLGYSFSTFASLYAYIGANILEWTFDEKTDEYVWGEKQDKILSKLEKIIANVTNVSDIDDTLREVLPPNSIKEYLSHKPIEVNFDTKFSVSKEQLEIAKSGDIQALMVLCREHYGDIIDNIVNTNYKIAENKEGLIQMKQDGYKGLTVALSTLPSSEDLGEAEKHFWLSYVFAHITFHVYYYAVALRVNDKEQAEKLFDSNKCIDDIYGYFFYEEHISKSFIRDEKITSYRFSHYWKEAMNYLDRIFNNKGNLSNVEAGINISEPIKVNVK